MNENKRYNAQKKNIGRKTVSYNFHKTHVPQGAEKKCG